MSYMNIFFLKNINIFNFLIVTGLPLRSYDYGPYGREMASHLTCIRSVVIIWPSQRRAPFSPSFLSFRSSIVPPLALLIIRYICICYR